MSKLKGAQLSFLEERAYQVRCETVMIVLCDMHVDLYRIVMEPRAVKFTGRTFQVEDCEHCASARKQS